MLQWLFEWLFKPYIDKLVDQRIKENVVERYTRERAEDTRRRIAKLRKSLDYPAQGVQSIEESDVLSSGVLQTGSEEPRVQVAPDQASIKKKQDLDAMKAKLMGKK